MNHPISYVCGMEYRPLDEAANEFRVITMLPAVENGSMVVMRINEVDVIVSVGEITRRYLTLGGT